MFKHYLNTAIRNLLRNRLYSLINICGLATAMAATLFIFLWIEDEMSFDRFHKYADRSFLMFKKYDNDGDIEINRSTPYLLGPELMKTIPSTESFVRKSYYYTMVGNGSENFSESRICTTDSNFFSFFTYSFIEGDPINALSEPSSIVITRSQALKYFQKTAVIGENLIFEDGRVYTVSAVIEDMPLNTHIRDNMFIRAESVYGGAVTGDWFTHYFSTYVRLVPGEDLSGYNSKATTVMRANMDENSVMLAGLAVKDLHLKRLDNSRSRIQYIYLFGGIAILLLIIACINYINIYTSLSARRSHEIGLKKVSGASRKQVFAQFMGESFIQVFAALVLAISLMEVFRPVFNNITGKEIIIPYMSGWFLLGLFFTQVIMTVMAGIYPALLISGTSPADVFRGSNLAGKGVNTLRKVLVVFQFSVSIGLIIVTLLINSQIKYILNRDLGFTREGVVYVTLNETLNRSFGAFSERIKEHPGVIACSRVSAIPSNVQSLWRGLSWEGREESEEVSAFGFLAADHNLLETLNLEMEEGRFFSDEFMTDSSAYIINRRAAEYMGMKNPLGKLFNTDDDPGPVIGVVKNFNSLPLNFDFEPMVIILEPAYYRLMLVRLTPGNKGDALGHIKKIWDEYVPGTQFNPVFLSEQIERTYDNTARISKLSEAFTLLAIIITSIGLFGLASHIVDERSKEIKIRKVMGASVNSVLISFTRNFTTWVLLACVFAWPASLVIIIKWLQNYAFRAPVNIWIFVLSAAIAMLIAIISVSYQAYRASISNPSKGLSAQ